MALLPAKENAILLERTIDEQQSSKTSRKRLDVLIYYIVVVSIVHGSKRLMNIGVHSCSLSSLGTAQTLWR